MAAVCAERRRIGRRIGYSLLQAPTGSGKTVMLAKTAEAVAHRVPIVWFWFAPFSSLVAQTANAVSFVARGTNARMLDLNEVALRKAVNQHRALKGMLQQAGIPTVPLLLVQASSTD